MADSTVLLEILVEGKNIKVVQRDAEALAGSVNKASNATEKQSKGTKKNSEEQKKASKTTRELYRNHQGLAQNTSNSSKAFAKQAQGMQGTLVPAYAALAANIFALTALFGALGRAQGLRQVEAGLIAVGEAAGQNLPYAAEQLVKLTGHAISTKQAMEATAVATSANFSTVQLEKLTKVAAGASKALGRDMGDALDRLVRGTAKLEPEILDELGIMVRLDEASEEYANSINKTVSELTRFEKQQAFLNATTQQGLEKFGELAETIEANPYDQLSASFSNLSDTALNLLNVALGPIIKFLSQNDFALISVLALFGSTIAKQIVPALGEMSKQSALMGKQALSASIVAGKALQTEYIAGLEGVKAAMKTVPPAFQETANAINNGTVSVKKLESGLKTLMASERVRRGQIASDKFATTDKHKTELLNIQALIVKTRELIAVERDRVPLAGFTGENLKNQALSSRLLSKDMLKIEQSTGIMGIFKSTLKGVTNQFKAVGKASKNSSKRGVDKWSQAGLVAVSSGRALAGTLKLIGSSFLKMIPFIGQAIFVFGILKQAWDALFGDSASQAATKEVIESFGTMNSIGMRLDKTLLSLGDKNFERQNAILKVQIGLLNQIEAGLDKATESAENTEYFFGLLGRGLEYALRRQLEAELEIEKERELSSTKSAFNRAASEKYFTMTLKRNNKIVESMRKKDQELKRAAFVQTLEAGITEIRMNETITKSMKEQLEGMKKILQDAADPESTKTVEELGKSFTELKAPLALSEAAQKSLSEAIQKGAEAEQKILRKNKTEYSDRIALLRESVNAMKTVTDNTPDLEFGNEKDLKKLKSTAKILTKVFDLDDGSYTEQLRQGTLMLEKQNTIVATGTAYAKLKTEEAKKYKMIAKESSIITSLYLDKEREANKKLLEVKNAESNILKVISAETKNKLTADIAALKKGEQKADTAAQILVLEGELAGVMAKEVGLASEISTLRTKIEDTTSDTWKIAQATNAEGKRTLNLDKKSLAISKEALANIDKLAKARAQLSQEETGTSSNAQDEYNLIKAANKARDTTDKKSLDLKLKGIELEYDLLEAKIAFEKSRLEGALATTVSQQEIERLESSLDLYDDIGGKVTSIRANSVLQAKATDANNKTLRQIAESVAKEKKNRAEIEASVESNTIALERASMLAGEDNVTALKGLELANERKRLQEDLDLLLAKKAAGEDRSLAITLKQNELYKNGTKEIERQLKHSEDLMKNQIKFASDQLSVYKEQNDLLEESARLQNTNILGKTKDSARAAVLAQEEIKRRVETSKIETAMKKLIIDAEFSLLEARWALLEAELRANGVTNEEQAILDASKIVMEQTRILNTVTKNNLDLEHDNLKARMRIESMKASTEAIEATSGDGKLGSGMVAAFEQMTALDTVSKEDKDKNLSPMEKALKDMVDISTKTTRERKESDIKLKESLETHASNSAETMATAVSEALKTMTVGTLNALVFNCGTGVPSPDAPKPEDEPGSIEPIDTRPKIVDNAKPEPTVGDKAIEDEKPAYAYDHTADIVVPKLPPEPIVPDIPTPVIPNPDGDGTPEPPMPDPMTNAEAWEKSKLMMRGFAEDMKKLGPEGEAVAAFTMGSLKTMEGLEDVVDAFGKGKTAADKMKAVGAVIGGLRSMMAAKSNMAVAGVDKEIAAEQKRDGKSKESLAKIKALEGKKDMIKRKAFETNKKMMMAEVIMATGVAIMNSIKMGLPWGLVFGAAAAAMGAAQLAMISGMTYQGGGSSAADAGSSPTVSVGKRKDTIDTAKSQSASGELAYMRGAKGTGGPENFTPAFMGAKYRAQGGPTTGYVVGEQGPELFVPQSPGRIVPNDEMNQAAPINANISINAIDSSGVEEVLVKQRGNIIGMMREAANSYGQNFMEEIDTSVYTPSSGGARRY